MLKKIRATANAIGTKLHRRYLLLRCQMIIWKMRRRWSKKIRGLKIAKRTTPALRGEKSVASSALALVEKSDPYAGNSGRRLEAELEQLSVELAKTLRGYRVGAAFPVLMEAIIAVSKEARVSKGALVYAMAQHDSWGSDAGGRVTTIALKPPAGLAS